MSQRIQSISTTSTTPGPAPSDSRPRRGPQSRDSINPKKPGLLIRDMPSGGLPDRAALMRDFAGEAGPKVIEEVAGAISKPLTHLGSIYQLFDGLKEIGKATHDGRRINEKRAFVAGFIETLYPALERPTITPAEAGRLGRGTALYRGTVRAILRYKAGSHSTRFRHLMRRLESYEAGMNKACRLLVGSGPEQRHELLDQLKSELRSNPQLQQWSDQKQALKALFNLRIH